MTLTMLRSSALAAALALVAMPVMAADHRFTLSNETSVTLVEFYASPTSADTWEEDILGADVLGAGDAATVSIGDERGCDYDFKAVFADGDVVTDKVNICEIESYTLSEG